MSQEFSREEVKRDKGELDLTQNTLSISEAQKNKLLEELGLGNRIWAQGVNARILQRVGVCFDRSPDKYSRQVIPSLPDRAGEFSTQTLINAEAVPPYIEDCSPEEGKSIRLTLVFHVKREGAEKAEGMEVTIELATHQIQLLGEDGSRVLLPKETVWCDKLSEEAQKVWDTLNSRDWFKNSSSAVQYGLRALVGDEKWFGFVRDLSERDGSSKEFQERSLQWLIANNFGGTVGFNFTMGEKHGQEEQQGQYEYFSWRQGRFAGAKGIIVVEDLKGDPVGIILRRGIKFPPGNIKVVEAVGGFKVEEEKPWDTMLREMKEEVGLEVDKVVKVVELGTILSDAGMTPNEVTLFAVKVKASTTKTLSEIVKNTDSLEGDSQAVFVPLGSLNQVISSLKESCVISIIAKAIAHGLLNKKSNKGGEAESF